MNDCCGAEVTDANFNLLHSFKNLYFEGAAAEPDFSRFYFEGITSNLMTVTDSTLTPIGSLGATFASGVFPRLALRGFDGTHRILGMSAYGVSFLPIDVLNIIPGSYSSGPTLGPSTSSYGAAFTPMTPESGTTVEMSGSNFSSVPSVVFSEGAVNSPATVLSSSATGPFSVRIPTFTSDCADVVATASNGQQAIGPQSFCYTPKVFVVDGDAGPSSGGSTLTLYGLGFGSGTPTVTIGGVAAPAATRKYSYTMTGPLGYDILTVTVPPHQPGDADIMITTSFGSTTLPHAFHYASRQDVALPTGATPIQLILDAGRGRILVTDSANNQLLVYGLSSLALLQRVPTGPGPQGLSLTPDGSKLLVVTGGDDKVSVLDAGSYATLQQATVPSTANSVFGAYPVGPPILVAGMAGNKAYIVTEAGYLHGGGGPYSDTTLFDYDLASNSVASDAINTSYFSGGEPYYMSSSTDGGTAVIGGRISHAVGTPPLAADTIVPTFADTAVTSDGSSTVLNAEFFDGTMRWQNDETADSLIALPPSAGLGETFLFGEQFNGTGSLSYRPAASHIRIYDTHHGNLVRTLAVPDSFIGSNPQTTPLPTRLLGVNPAGQQIVAITSAGLSSFTFVADPLSIYQAVDTAGQLKVTGSGFTAASSVMVDTLPVPASFASTGELDVTLSTLSAGVHSVTVANADGESYTLVLAFTTM